MRMGVRMRVRMGVRTVRNTDDGTRHRQVDSSLHTSCHQELLKSVERDMEEMRKEPPCARHPDRSVRQISNLSDRSVHHAIFDMAHLISIIIKKSDLLPLASALDLRHIRDILYIKILPI